MLGRWFAHEVYETTDGRVIKIPRDPKNTSIANEQKSLDIHSSFVGEFIPDTKILKDEGYWFIINQKLVIDWNPVDLLEEWVQDDVKRLLEWWTRMQKNHSILFDVFWMHGMIRLFNYYFNWTIIKKLSDILLPMNAKYLELVHKVSPDLLYELNKDNGIHPFFAYNILRDKEWKLHFIDTEYRPIDIFHPLNMFWNWITQKALNEILNNPKRKDL